MKPPRPQLFRREYPNGGPLPFHFQQEVLTLSDEPRLRLRLDRAECMAEIRGVDVVFDHVVALAMEIPEPQPTPLPKWLDKDGKKHIGEPHRRIHPERGVAYEPSDETKRLWQRASHAVRQALKTGRLVRPELCENCSSAVKPIEPAHYTYDLPLAVRWLCQSCHRRWDAIRPKSPLPTEV